jgi:hypothetical protein
MARMKRIAILLSAGAALALLGGCAYQDSGYDGYYGGNGYGYGSGYSSYGGYDSGYRNRGDYGNGYREHEQLHRDLGAAHDQAHDEGIHGSADHADTHDALDAAHTQWHRDHPGVPDNQ